MRCNESLKNNEVKRKEHQRLSICRFVDFSVGHRKHCIFAHHMLEDVSRFFILLDISSTTILNTIFSNSKSKMAQIFRETSLLIKPFEVILVTRGRAPFGQQQECSPIGARPLRTRIVWGGKDDGKIFCHLPGNELCTRIKCHFSSKLKLQLFSECHGT